ncbi:MULTISPECIES: thioredoxin [Corynebacterium]|uniref:Thioredoxin n=1 Tax=Corynebacterium hadale TaxID=2026255 RepID=A0A269PBH7_9CORY|nr:thioredoxin [Corynebacterium hadale]PAJ68948.1 thioredoxin [Corynebacterium hadale]PAT12480.1 thioredoxin [Corynebacterium hadale]WKC61361.1 Thioredoxin-1 [Corynebacterium hadale]
MSAPVDVTQETFKSEVIESELPVLVDFSAEWCQPCQRLAPVLDEIAAEYDGKLKVVKIDADTERTLTAMFQVFSIPTVLLYKDGEKVDEFTNYRPKQEIVSRIEPLL